MRNAFVTVVQSDGNGLFYKVCYTDAEGRLWNLLNPEDYPWYWGFKELKHALAIANHNNREFGDDDDPSNRELAYGYSDEERQQS